MSRQFSSATLAVVSVGALAVGGLFAQFSGAKLFKIPKHKHIVITIQNNQCSQKAEGVRDSYTFLRKQAVLFSGDSVEWTVIDLDHHATDFVITFPQQTPDGHVGTPFVDASKHAKYRFTSQPNDNQSGGSLSDTNPDDYPYYSVSAGGVACSNPSDPGVHVDQ